MNGLKFSLKKYSVSSHNEASQQSLNSSDSLYNLINSNLHTLAGLESDLNGKSPNDSITEIERSLDILNYSIDINSFNSHEKDIVFIPSKYEFWEYFLFACNISKFFNIYFIYHSWSKNLVKFFKKNFNFNQKYKINFISIDKLNSVEFYNPIVINAFQTLKNYPLNVPFFSSTYISSTTDLDYALGFILENAFSFAGLKNSSIKRISISKKIYNDFYEKLTSRIHAIDNTNPSPIKSEMIRENFRQIVLDGISEGGEMIKGNEVIENNRIQNIIMQNINSKMRIYQKKVYGPLLLLLSVDESNEEEFVNIINNQPSKGIIFFGDEKAYPELVSQLPNQYDTIPIVNKFNPKLNTEYRPDDLSVMFENNMSLLYLIDNLKYYIG